MARARFGLVTLFIFAAIASVSPVNSQNIRRRLNPTFAGVSAGRETDPSKSFSPALLVNTTANSTETDSPVETETPQTQVPGNPTVAQGTPEGTSSPSPAQATQQDGNSSTWQAWQSIIFYVMIGVLVASCGIYNTCFRQRFEHDSYNHMPEEMTFRHDLIESETEIAAMWVCDVCAFHNYQQKSTCMLCGSDKGYLASHRKSESEFTKSKLADRTSSASQGTSAGSFVTKKLSALNQRQLGARKRHEWKRKINQDGMLVWVRRGVPKNAKLSALRLSGKEEVERSSASSAGSVAFVSRLVSAENPIEGRLTFDLAEGATITTVPRQGLLSAFDLQQVAALPFRRKHAWFMQQCASLEIPWEYGHMMIEVDRENLLHGSCEQLLWATKEQLHQSLRIKFRNEPGVDAGGLEREWFTLMAHEIFEETTGLFAVTHVSNMSYTINPCSEECSEDHLMYFHAIGRFLGRALFQGHLVPAHLSLPIYKHIQGIPLSFSDLQFVDIELYNSLKWMKDNSGTDVLCLDFSVVMPFVDGQRVVDLKPNGRSIEVTDENKHEYIDLRTKWILVRSISSQLAALMKGLFDVIPPELLAVFDHQELELLMCGVPEIDVDDWQSNSQYFGEFSPQVVEWFWEVVRSYDMEQRARLLQFTTGSARVPVQGFKALTMNDGRVCLFTLQSITKEDSIYPRAHTCFNRIDLPSYSTKQELETALTLVINLEVTGFTIE